MRTQEVVVGHEQSSEGHSAIARSKPAGGTDMVLVSTVESLDKLFKGAILLGDMVEIF